MNNPMATRTESAPPRFIGCMVCCAIWWTCTTPGWPDGWTLAACVKALRGNAREPPLLAWGRCTVADRKHDDAHRPMQGRGQRGNRPGRPLNLGGAVLVEHKLCPACGELNDEHHRCAHGVKASVAHQLLGRGDIIQRGDEVLADDTVTWLPLHGWEIGSEWGSNFMPMRRRADGVKEDQRGD
jgi:hypothetical protein